MADGNSAERYTPAKLPDWKAVVALLALVVSSFTFIGNFVWSGRLIVHSPESFCIVRGMASGGHPSDHLVIPFWIENSGQGAKVFQQPYLELTEVNKKRESVWFYAAGLVDTLRYDDLGSTYHLEHSWAVPEGSLAQYKILFHVQDWWDETQPEFHKFRFHEGEQWIATLHYHVDGKKVPEEGKESKVVLHIPIYDTIENLVPGGAYNADCFPKEISE